MKRWKIKQIIIEFVAQLLHWAFTNHVSSHRIASTTPVAVDLANVARHIVLQCL
jgi:hypothetical protein